MKLMWEGVRPEIWGKAIRYGHKKGITLQFPQSLPGVMLVFYA